VRVRESGRVDSHSGIEVVSAGNGRLPCGARSGAARASLRRATRSAAQGLKRMKHLARFLLASVLLWTPTARADSWTNTDNHPRLVAPGVWYFSVNVPVQPVGQLQFVNAQYDFYDSSSGIGAATNGISVDYAYDGPGVDWTDGRTFLA